MIYIQTERKLSVPVVLSVFLRFPPVLWQDETVVCSFEFQVAQNFHPGRVWLFWKYQGNEVRNSIVQWLVPEYWSAAVERCQILDSGLPDLIWIGVDLE